MFTEEALDMLAQHLGTALQIEKHLTLALEEGYRLGQKPVQPEIIETVLAKDINGLEPTLTRNGYNVKALSDLLNVKPAEVRLFLHGRLDTTRAQELQDELLVAGVPL